MNAADVTSRLARNLQRARVEHGLSQPELAERMGDGVRRNEISQWEHGRRRISEKNLLRAAEVLDHDFGWFYIDHSCEPAGAAA